MLGEKPGDGPSVLGKEGGGPKLRPIMFGVYGLVKVQITSYYKIVAFIKFEQGLVKEPLKALRTCRHQNGEELRSSVTDSPATSGN